MAKLGYYTGEIAAPPYLSRSDIQDDCLSGLIEGAYRRGRKGYWMIPANQVERYYREKELPEFVIEAKLKQLGLLTAKIREQIAKNILDGDFGGSIQLQLLAL